MGLLDRFFTSVKKPTASAAKASFKSSAPSAAKASFKSSAPSKSGSAFSAVDSSRSSQVPRWDSAPQQQTSYYAAREGMKRSVQRMEVNEAYPQRTPSSAASKPKLSQKEIKEKEARTAETNLTSAINGDFSGKGFKTGSLGTIELTEEQFNSLNPAAKKAVEMQTQIYNGVMEDEKSGGGRSDATIAALQNLGLDPKSAKAYQSHSGFLGLGELKDLDLEKKLTKEVAPKKSDYMEQGYGAMQSARAEASREEREGKEKNKKDISSIRREEAGLSPEGSSGTLQYKYDSAYGTGNDRAGMVTKAVKAKQRGDDPKGWDRTLLDLPDEITGKTVDNLILRDLKINMARKANTESEKAAATPRLDAMDEEALSRVHQVAQILMNPNEADLIDGLVPREDFESAADFIGVPAIELGEVLREYSQKANAAPELELGDLTKNDLLKLDYYMNVDLG